MTRTYRMQWGGTAPTTVVVCKCILAALLALAAAKALAQPVVDPVSIRAAARASGLDSLRNARLPESEGLGGVLNSDVRATAVQLGKALFWDTQVGSDGQACGTCHFHAGADSRTRNQLSPGLRNVNPSGVFNATRTGAGGPDYTLVPDDFPFHVVANPEQNNFLLRAQECAAAPGACFDSDDVVSSQGVSPARFTGVTAGVSTDHGTPFADPIFNLATPNSTSVADNVRRVEPRNTPTMINAVFNHSNFWDGRAHNLFNGVSPIGPLDTGARIWVADTGGNLAQRRIRIANSSLASQAVGPPTSDLEMAFFNKPFPMVGRKLLSLVPLGLQRVDPTDGVLGPLSRAGSGQNGLATTYGDLIQAGFEPQFWSSTQLTPDGFTQMEANFSLFFGVAIQLYERTLVSDRAPFDRFMSGRDSALAPEQLQGLLVFLNKGEKGNPPEVDAAIAAFEAANPGSAIGAGNCVSCHSGPEFTAAAFTSLSGPNGMELIGQEETLELVDGFLAEGEDEALGDAGFANIGVRPAREDLGRGGMEGGFPLSFTRQALLFPDLRRPRGAGLPCTPGVDCPERLQVDGAFKIPGLRNVELTGPYFHNGGQATLGQVVEFYDRQTDFADVNLANVDEDIVFIDLEDSDEDPLVQFLLSLTDPRVANESAPFDHPQIVVPDAGTAAAPRQLDVPAVGAGGRTAAGMAPLGSFLALPQQ